MSAAPTLEYQQQDCAMTLRAGLAEYHRYLVAIGRRPMVDTGTSRLILEHNATHVTFGMDTSLEQEAGLDTWLLFGCDFRWRYVREYSKLPELKALYRALVSELGWSLFPRIYWKTLGMKWRVLRRTRGMRTKWPFQFPDEWLDRPVSVLRAEHGIVVLLPNERDTGPWIQWSGQY